MSLTPAAGLAWKIAAAEAADDGHGRIDSGHLVIGLLSLEKVAQLTAAEVGLDPVTHAAARREWAQLGRVLSAAGATAGELRRAIRRGLGRGAGLAPPGPLSRSVACKAVFAQAELLARPAGASVLHLLAAFAGSPEPALALALAEAGTPAQRLADQALAELGLISPEAPE